MKKYKAILFDMDGVIADSMEQHVRAWQQVFLEQGVDIPKMEIFEREGMSGVASIEDILKSKGFDVPNKEGMQALLKKKLAVFEKVKVNIFPKALEILEFVHSRSLKTALVTGSLRRSVSHILPKKVLSYFDAVVAVDDYTNGKPHPEPYEKAIAILGVKPKEALAVENAPLGISSAKAAGAGCLAVETTLGRSYLTGADRVFGNHDELLKYLKDIL